MKPLLTNGLISIGVGILVALALGSRHGFVALRDVLAAIYVFGAASYVVWALMWRLRRSPAPDVAEFNRRAHSFVGWGLLALIGLLAIACLARPSLMDSREIEDITIAVLNPQLNSSKRSGPIYIRLGPNGVLPEHVRQSLTAGRAPGSIAAWKDRPRESCAELEGTMRRRCDREDYIEVLGVDIPLWHLAQVRYRTAACGSSVLLIKGISRWHLVYWVQTCA